MRISKKYVFGISVLATCFAATFIPQNLYGQDVSIEIHAKPFNIDRRNLDTRLNDSDSTTNRLDDSDVLDIGLTLGVGNRKNLIWIMDVNWIHENFRQDFTWPEFANSNNFQSSLITLGLERIDIGLGLDKLISVHERIDVSFGSRIVFGHQFDYNYTRYDEITDSLGVLTSSREEVRKYPVENTIGLDAIGKVYFTIIPRLSLGLQLINRFGLTFATDTYIQERRTFDANGTETDFFKQEVAGTQNRFAYNFSVSFGIQYQIAKRKEKKE